MENLKSFLDLLYYIMTIGRLVKISVIFIIFFVLICNYLFHVDVKNKCFLRIKLSLLEMNNTSMKNAIKILKYASPEDYRDLCENVRVIDPSIIPPVGCPGFEGGCFHPKTPKVIYVSTSQRTLSWTASVMVHETCHAIQYRESRPFSEEECYSEGGRILEKITEF